MRSTEQNPEVSSGRGELGRTAVVVGLAWIVLGAFPAAAQLDRDVARPRREAVPAKSAPAQPAPTQPAASEPEPGAPVAAPNTSADSMWSIVIAAFKGEEAREQAERGLEQIHTRGRLPEAFAEMRGATAVIGVGRFSDPSSPEAQAELKRVQAIEVEGVRAYGLAFMSPPLHGSDQGVLPKYNLLRTKEQYGPRAMYTLQVGAYGRKDLARPTEADLAEARRAAEQAAVQLRREGELAFYYHGPSLSMVTIGVFDSEDFDPQTPKLMSARVREAMKRYPNNLYNGKGVLRRGPDTGPEGRLQSSALVIIPEK